MHDFELGGLAYSYYTHDFPCVSGMDMITMAYRHVAE
jgi:hypothetical protein